MELWIAKVIALFLILLVTLFFCLLPVKLVTCLQRQEQEDDSAGGQGNGTRRTSRARTILSYFNCFSAGVFMAISLLHLIPEVMEEYQNVINKAGFTFHYPLSQVIIAVGFFLIMLIEHGVMSYHSMKQQEGNQGEHSEHSERQPFLAGKHAEDYQSTEGVADRLVQGAGADNTFVSSYEKSHECNEEGPHHHHFGQTHEETGQIHGIRSLMLLMALSVHTVFEGLALGLQKTTGNIWILFAGLAVHKAIISFSLGLQLTDTFHLSARVTVYMVLYSFVCPIGIAIGTAVSRFDTESLAMSATSMTLQGLATGTFLYVTFFEMLLQEFDGKMHSVTKVLAVIFGFAVMSLSTLLEHE